MKRLRRLCVALMTAFVAGTPTWAQFGPNLLAEGDFEAGLQGWQAAVSGAQAAAAGLTVDDGQAKVGARSLKFTVPKEGGVSATSPVAPVEGGKVYLYSFWFCSEGFSKTGLFAGCNAQYSLTWLNAEGKVVGSVGVGLSYGEVPAWRFMARTVRAPAEATGMRANYAVTVNAEGIPSRLWLDRVQLRALSGAPAPGGKVWVFRAADGFYDQGAFRRVADDDTGSGFAVIGATRFQNKPSYLSGGMYTRALPAGQFQVTYRVKAAEIATETEPLLSWDINTDLIGHLAAGNILTTDFRQPGAYQDFTFDFVKPPNVRWVDFRAFWQGGVTTWIDTITVREVRLFTDADNQALMD